MGKKKQKNYPDRYKSLLYDYRTLQGLYKARHKEIASTQAECVELARKLKLCSSFNEQKLQDYDNLQRLYKGRRQEICDLQSAYSELEERFGEEIIYNKKIVEDYHRKIRALESANANLIQAMSNINYANNI